jgi:hypothetical protein
VEEWLIVGLAGLIGSVVVIVGGLRMHRSPSERRGWIGAVTLLLGILGLVASAGWLILAAYVDANVR